ncbi:MAG: lipase [Bacteroidetes bacterium QS_4_64_154]|nr:MAG: lipase [Bacteroidetes bacterium QS_4_64_154]
MPNDDTLSASALRRITGLEPSPQPSIIPVRTPIVLMHGFGVGASFRRGGHLHQEALHLRSRGVRAIAPNVSPYSTVRARTAQWDDRLRRVLEEVQTQRLVLVAHSMGGLDARYLISEMGWHEQVDALVTIATPHRGSAVASLVLDQPELVRNWLTDAADWLGTHILDHPDVAYWSYGCQAGKGTDAPIAPIFRYSNQYLFEREGVNDGIVSVQSAHWGEYQGTVDADHSRQVGLSPGLASHFDSNAFYASIVKKLADDGY